METIKSLDQTMTLNAPWGFGKIKSPYEDSVTEEFLESCRAGLVPVTEADTAFCIDGRRLVSLADSDGVFSGTISEPLARRIVLPRLAGGVDFTSTMAVLEAGLQVDSFDEAHHMVRDVLRQNGISSAGHEDCAAELNAAKTANDPLEPDEAFEFSVDTGLAHPMDRGIFEELHHNTKQLAVKGVYSNNVAARKQYILDTSPYNYSKLLTADDATNGHHEPAGGIIDKKGYSTNLDMFVYTHWFARELAHNILAPAFNLNPRHVEMGSLDYHIRVFRRLFAPPEPGYKGMPLFVFK